MSSSSTPGTAAHQSPLSMGFSRQEPWSGLPGPPPGDLPDPQTKPAALTSPALAGGFFTTSATWEAQMYSFMNIRGSGKWEQARTGYFYDSLLSTGKILAPAAHPLPNPWVPGRDAGVGEWGE